MLKKEFLGSDYYQCECEHCGETTDLFYFEKDDDVFCEDCIKKLIKDLNDEEDFLNMEYANSRF